MNLKGQVWLHLLVVHHLPLANPHPQDGLVGQSCFHPCSSFACHISSCLNMRRGPLQTLPYLLMTSHLFTTLNMISWNIIMSDILCIGPTLEARTGSIPTNLDREFELTKMPVKKKTFWVDKNAGEISSNVKSSRSVRCHLRCLQRKQQCRAIELWSSSFLSLKIDIHEIGQMPVGFGKWHWLGVEKGKKTWKARKAQ